MTNPTRDSIDARCVGEEPVYDPLTEMSDLKMIEAYNWYNYTYDASTARKYFLAWMKQRKLDFNTFSGLPDTAFIPIGWTARIVMQGGKLPADTLERAEMRLVSMKEKAARLSNAADNKTQKQQIDGNSTTSIQERIAEQVSDYIARFEEEFDKILLAADKKNHKFENPYEYLTKHDVKGIHAKRIVDYYKPVLDELNNFNDPEIREGYSDYKKNDIKALSDYLQEVIDSCAKISSNAKAQRKPRKTKTKSAIQLISKIKYKEKDDSLKISSINPTLIVGASQLWTFNTKTRFLGVYNASNESGLKIKGTTLYNFDESSSITKKIRKPNEIISEVIQAGKISLRKLMENIKAKQKTLNGRLNSDILLLRIVK